MPGDSRREPLLTREFPERGADEELCIKIGRYSSVCAMNVCLPVLFARSVLTFIPWIGGIMKGPEDSEGRGSLNSRDADLLKIPQVKVGG